MFNLFNKKSATKNIGSIKAPVSNEVLVNDIVVHAMPERFRAVAANTGSAEKTGLIILIVGSFFLVITALLFYYFLFVYKPVTSAPADLTVGNQVNEEKIGLLEQKEKPAESAMEEAASQTSDKIEPATSTAPVEPEIEPATSTSELATSTVDTGATIKKALDSDSDGLTDLEEDLYGSDVNNGDSDGDGYSDLNEVKNGYNPAGPGKLEENKRIKKFVNSTYGYSLLYPADWQEKVSGGDYSILFIAADNQFIQVDVQTNTKHQSISDWYKEQFNLAFLQPDRLLEQPSETGGAVNWLGVKNEDGLTAYLTDSKNDNIYTINYNLGLENNLNYQNIFAMALNSLKLKE